MGRRLPCLPVVLVAIAALSIAGCDAANRPGRGSEGHPTSVPPSVSATPSSGDTADDTEPVDPPDPTSTSRPIQPVPSVTPSGMADPPPGEGMARYVDQHVDWIPCSSDGTVLCARVWAPLDYADPDGKAIKLSVSRKSSTAEKSKGALFINPGGPGGSGVDYVDYFDGHGVEKAYDIVGWDPRGVGESTPVQCFDSQELDYYTSFDYSPDDKAETAQLTELNTRFGQACLENSGELLKHISTEDTVRDLDLLRQLLDQPELNYFGSSYGTSIGAMYATQFPDTVGRMVLDGATSIGTTSEVRQSDGFERTLGNFAAWCAEEHCPLGDSKKDVLSTVEDLLVGLDQEPLRVDDRELTQALATSGLVYALYSPADSWPNLMLGLMRAIEHDDGSELLRWADRYNQRDPAGDFGQFNASFPAIRCLDTTDQGVHGALEEWKDIRRTAPILGGLLGPDLTCPTWPVKSTGDLERPIHYDGDVPVLILGTTGDPATPYEYAERMREALDSSRLVTLKANGHLAFDQSECVQQLVVRHLVDGKSPKKDKTCSN